MNIAAMSITQESAQQQKSFSHYVSELEPHKLFSVNQHGEPTSGMVTVLAGSDAHQLDADTLGLSQKPASSLTEENILCGSTHQNDHIPRFSEIDDIAEFKGVAAAWIEQWPTTKLKGNFALINLIRLSITGLTAGVRLRKYGRQLSSGKSKYLLAANAILSKKS